VCNHGNSNGVFSPRMRSAVRPLFGLPTVNHVLAMIGWLGHGPSVLAGVADRHCIQYTYCIQWDRP
jgi:hypothetical protein